MCIPLACVQFVDKVTELTSALSFNIFEMQPYTNLYFVLGPSPLRPLETYVLSCSATAHAVAEADDRATAVARDVSRKVLRSLIMNTAAVPEGNVSTGIHGYLLEFPFHDAAVILTCMHVHLCGLLWHHGPCMPQNVPHMSPQSPRSCWSCACLLAHQILIILLPHVQVQQSCSCFCKHLDKMSHLWDSCQRGPSSCGSEEGCR